ncbi:MAG: protein kinase domain-containing protein [Nannocystaceae bacterium]|nr:protein kinase [bacterium]
MPDRIAGRYAIKRLLGRGGFGAVYEAHDELEDRSVALKLIRGDQAELAGLPLMDSSRMESRSLRRPNVTRSFGTPGTGGSSGVAQAFKDEFRLLTQLHHPNLATVYDFGRSTEEEGFYFTQELVRGVELSVFLRNASREVIAEVFVQLARALDYIHALGLMHGDIKPSNVLVCATDDPSAPPQAKLIDFGLARMLRDPLPPEDTDEDEESEEEDTITVLGTPGFSAPEKVRGQATDARADIYSLAATMYAAIRGTRPFPGKSFREVLRVQRDWRPELAGALLQSAGPVVAELVGRMLQLDPNNRPQSARSILLELLRREASHLRNRQQSEENRREFARVLVSHLPFVDRAHYLELLMEKAAAVICPDPETTDGVDPASSSEVMRSGRLLRSVVVKAPEGMGKGRLMSELRREVQLADGLFVEGNCWTSGRNALGPFASIVTQLSTALGDKSVAVRSFPELVHLARRDRGHESAASAVTEFLISAAQERPYVLLLTSLSKAPEAVRTQFDQLSRAIDHSGAPILLCATTEPHSKVLPVVQGLSRDQCAEVWNLRPFTAREMQSVLQGVLGDTPVIRDLAEMLDKLTGGHPLSFRETLRVLIEEGILVRDTDSWTLRGASAAADELHKTLAQRSETRLDTLGVSGWEIASILYLLEAPIEESTLAELSDLRKERFTRTLDRLEGEGLIARSPVSGSSTISLAHESVREAVRQRYEDSLDETRLDLAARIEEFEPGDPMLLFLRARLLDDASEAIESVDALERAADALFVAKRPQLAAQVLERIISRLRKYGRTASLDRLLAAQIKLLESAAGALEDPRREAAHYEAGILVAELLGDNRAQASFWLGLADRYTQSDGGGMELTLERLEKAADAAKSARDRPLELRIANRRAEVLLGAGEIEKARRASRRAMAVLDLDDASPVDKCKIIGVRLRTLSLSGQLGEARALHDMAKPIAAACPVLQRQSYLSGIAFLAVLGGDPQRAIPETEDAISALQDANLPRLLLTPMHNLGDLRLRAGDLVKAETSFREAIRLASVYGFDYHLHLNRGFLGYVLARSGDIDQGAELLGEAKDAMAVIVGEHLALQQLRLLDAEVAHIMGDSARARRELEEMLADFQAGNELSLAHWAQEALARIERDLGTAFIEAPDEDDLDSDPEQDTVRTKPVR